MKWSDAPFERPSRLTSLIAFAGEHQDSLASPHRVTTKTRQGLRKTAGLEIEFTPAALYCYTVSRNVIEALNAGRGIQRELELKS